VGLIHNGEMYHIHFGDCIEHMHGMEKQSVDFAMTSPPFPRVFAYSNSEVDIGNSEVLTGEAKLHFGWFFRGMRRVMKPGRAFIVHCTQIHKSRKDGDRGCFDFRGLLIRLGQRAGFIYEYDWLCRQNPQAQALRTKQIEIKFQGLERDRAYCRGAMGDYLIKFQTPGTNKVPVNSEGQVSRNDWIKWAEGTWDDIKMTETLNTKEGKSDDDTVHICPFPLEIPRRLVLMYSNPGEIVFDPFTGIGSTGYAAMGGRIGKGNNVRWIEDKRRFYGCELKKEYYDTAISNCEMALRAEDGVVSLFDSIEEEVLS
jgi:DNA modification methylase